MSVINTAEFDVNVDRAAAIDKLQKDIDRAFLNRKKVRISADRSVVLEEPTVENIYLNRISAFLSSIGIPLKEFEGKIKFFLLDDPSVVTVTDSHLYPELVKRTCHK